FAPSSGGCERHPSAVRGGRRLEVAVVAITRRADPLGTRVAFARTPNCCYELLVEVLHLGTGAIDTLQRPNGTPIAGIRPRWSPATDVIAYSNAGQIWLIQPDGSNERTGSPPGPGYGRFDRAPD